MSLNALDSSVAGWFSRWRLFFWLTLMVVIPLALLAVAAAINAENEYRNAEKAALEQASTLARQAAARLDQHYDELDQFLPALAEVARETALRGADGDPALARMVRAMPQHVTGLSILSLSGRMVGTTRAAPETRAALDFSDRRYFREALAQRQRVVSEIVYSRIENRWALISALRVEDDQGHAVGVVTVSSRVDRMQTIIVPYGLPLGALLTVFDNRGVGIASTAEPMAAIGRDFSKSETVLRVLHTLTLNEKTLASDGQMRLVAYAAGEKLPWIVEVGLEFDRAVAPARQQLRERLALLGAALVLGLAAAALLARRIGEPIGELARDADAFGRGDAISRTRAQGYCEVNQLSAAFNRMIGAIDTQRQDLKASEERFRSLVMLSSDWYWTQDAGFRFDWHSQGRFGDGIALGAGDFHGKTRWEMPGAEPLGTTWEAHRALLSAHRTWRDLVVRYVDLNGETQYISSSGEPVFRANGEFAGYRGVAQLVTERFRLEAERDSAGAALRNSEAKFRALTALSSDWYWEQDADFRFTSVGTEDPNWALPMLGKTRWELNGEPLGQTWADHRQQLARHETFRNLVFRYTAVDGTIAHLSVSGEPMFGEAGVFRGYRGTATSVTARVRLEQALQERMELLRVTLDTAPVAIGVVRTRDNVALLSNRAAYDMLRIDPDQREWNVLDYWERREDAREVERRIKRDGYVRDMEALVRVPGRERVWGQVSAQPARYLGEDVTVATVIDITERKTMEAQRESLLTNLRGANERLRRLSAQVLDAQEAERRQIAHELHDEIGQNLSALKLFAGHLRGNAPAALHGQIDEWIEVLDSSLAQLRDLSRLLRPVQLDHMGLLPALRALLDTQAHAAGWLTQFEASGSDARFDTRVETVCYRVVQEALTNAVRHAAAASVALRVQRNAQDIRIEIEDDGRGFDLDAARSRIQQGQSMGLLGMEERVQLAGGTLEIDAALARGTRLIAVLPLALAGSQPLLQPSLSGEA